MLQLVKEGAAQQKGMKGACTWVCTSWQAEGPWAQCGAVQPWSAGLHSPGVALARYISSLSAWLSASTLHCNESLHPGHPRWYNSSYWSYLSMSKLLGGAQYVLTVNFGQRIVCKMPLTSWCLPAPGWCTRLVALPAAGESSWGTRLCLYHSPAGTELAVKCNLRADIWEAPGTLFLLFIQTWPELHEGEDSF